MGVIIDGCPSNVFFDSNLLASDLERRRPGRDKITSARNEVDSFEVLSGVYEGKTLGTPIAITVKNQDARSTDYVSIDSHSRPGHADDVWKNKFDHVDLRGGGRASGRETVCRVIAGSVAKMVLINLGSKIKVSTVAKNIGPIQLSAQETPFDSIQVRQLLESAVAEGKSYGGIIETTIDNVQSGLGQPVFHKLKADLAHAYMGIGATCGVEFGEGFGAAAKEGSAWHSIEQKGYGGIRGGLSTGDQIVVRVAFKPTSSVLDIAKRGRHDPCIVPRALPVVEAMTYLVLVDHILWSRTDKR